VLSIDWATHLAHHADHSVKRGVLAALVALIALGVDFVIFPDLIEDRVLVKTISATEVVNGDLITLGKYRLHTLRVSYGRLINPKYVESLGPRVNALAVTAYAASATDKMAIGVLADADEGKTILSTRETDRLGDLVRSAPSLPPGRIQVFHPNKDEAGSLAGIKTILVLRTKRGDDRDAKDALRDGLVRLLDESGTQSVSGLIVPALTVGTAEKGTPTFNEFFGFLFDALGKSPSPRLIDLTLYAGWSTADLEAAVAALNAQWSARDHAGYLPMLHRYQLRLVLIGLAICFIASSRHIVLGIRTTLILATGFALSLLGSFKTVETLAEGLGSDAKTILLMVFTVVLAIGFPHFVTWSVKDLFKGMSHGAQ
jgi:hypothetical protein